MSSWTWRPGSMPRMLRGDLAQDFADQRHAGQLLEREHLGAQPVVDVVGVVGDVVGDGAATCASALG